MTDAILVLNAGSSSLKFAMFERRHGLPLLVKGSISALHDKPRLKVSTALDQPPTEVTLGKGSIDSQATLEFILRDIGERGLPQKITNV
ncbi:hypothetical protein KGO5_05359 [Sinorhizobium sp. KGO-5]|uniref:hypothetical protein n=1 Tax=Sinorhizobium sp. KGO-5 TaxID=1470810 RepID=UPI0029499EE8|nr:hypothetical protein KGO5_05359 [Sinorhizobium sp. KGO-5]